MNQPPLNSHCTAVLDFMIIAKKETFFFARPSLMRLLSAKHFMNGDWFRFYLCKRGPMNTRWFFIIDTDTAIVIVLTRLLAAKALFKRCPFVCMPVLNHVINFGDHFRVLREAERFRHVGRWPRDEIGRLR